MVKADAIIYLTSEADIPQVMELFHHLLELVLQCKFEGVTDSTANYTFTGSNTTGFTAGLGGSNNNVLTVSGMITIVVHLQLRQLLLVVTRCSN